MEQKKKSVIGAALLIEFTVCVLQGLHHEWLISGMGILNMSYDENKQAVLVAIADVGVNQTVKIYMNLSCDLYGALLEIITAK